MFPLHVTLVPYQWHIYVCPLAYYPKRGTYHPNRVSAMQRGRTLWCALTMAQFGVWPRSDHLESQLFQRLRLSVDSFKGTIDGTFRFLDMQTQFYN